MNVRSIRSTELTPEARIDAAKRKLTEAIDELIDAKMAKGTSVREWVSQHDSPLGHDRHLRLVRNGTLKGVTDGRKRFVRRSDIDAYLEANRRVVPVVAADDDVSAMIDKIAGRR